MNSEPKNITSLVPPFTRDTATLKVRVIASINDLPIKESERKYHWPLGQQPDGHLGLSYLGL
jgi:nuclear transport factor 2 (NTF2) superfamily protein